MKQDQATNNNERKPQGVASAQPGAPSSQKEVPNRKGERQRKGRPGKMANPAGQGK